MRLTVVVDELLDIPEDLRVALMGVGRHGHQILAVFLVDSGGLRVQHKGDRQKTLLNERPAVIIEWCTHFDPFNLEYVSCALNGTKENLPAGLDDATIGVSQPSITSMADSIP